MELRVWHITNIPNSPRHYGVHNPTEAARLINRLAAQQLTDPDVHSNAFGLEVMVKGEWEEWEDAHGDSVDELAGQLFEG